MGPLRIAVAVDFSPESELAARQALELARATGGEVALVHAVEWPDEVAAPSLRPEVARALETRRSHLAQAFALDQERLAQLRQSLSGQGVEVSQSVVEGHPETSLPEAARELGAALLLVGTHGRTGLSWFFLGSVAERIIRASEIDVLVARGEGAARGGFHRVLVATDFSTAADRALARAITLAAKDAVIEVVHFYAGHPYAELHDQLRSLGDQDLDEVLVADLRAAGELLVADKAARGRAPRFSVARQRAIPGIVHRLESERYDLVALGSHGRRGLTRFVLGSVAETVARRAPCSVLIAKSGHADE